jgi:hypothetical protein
VNARRAVLVAAIASALPVLAGHAQGGVEIRVGGIAMPSHRAAQFGGAVGTGSGLMPGGEVLLRLRYVGLTARLFGGAFSADSGTEAVGTILAGDVRALVGPRVVAADVGYGRRAFSGTLGSRSWPFARVGLRSTVALGASGLAAEVRAAYYAGLGNSGASGRDFETRLVWTPSHLPLYVGVGYRFERFSTASTPEDRPEVVHGLVLAAGLRVIR